MEDKPSSSRHFIVQSKVPRKLLKRPMEPYEVPKRPKIEEMADPRLKSVKMEEIMETEEVPLVGPTVAEIKLEPEDLLEWEDVSETKEVESMDVQQGCSSSSSASEDQGDCEAGYEAALEDTDSSMASALPNLSSMVLEDDDDDDDHDDDDDETPEETHGEKLSHLITEFIKVMEIP